MDIAAHIRAARKAHGMTQEEVAQRTGFSRSAVVELEAGRGRMPTLAAVAAVVEFRVRGLSNGRTLGDQVRNRRIRLKLTQKQVADRAKVSVPTVRAVETDRATVSSLSKVIAAIGNAPRPRAADRSYWRGGARDVRFTPPDLLRGIEAAIGPIDCDPCHHPDSFVSPRQQGISIEHCGLQTPWKGRIAFMNPPYSELSTWLRRAHRAWSEGEVEIVVGLVPVRTEVRAFHECVFGSADVLMMRNRISFYDHQGPIGRAGFSLALVIWGATGNEVARLAETIPSSWMQSRSAA